MRGGVPRARLSADLIKDPTVADKLSLRSWPGAADGEGVGLYLNVTLEKDIRIPYLRDGCPRKLRQLEHQVLPQSAVCGEQSALVPAGALAFPTPSASRPYCSPASPPLARSGTWPPRMHLSAGE